MRVLKKQSRLGTNFKIAYKELIDSSLRNEYDGTKILRIVILDKAKANMAQL